MKRASYREAIKWIAENDQEKERWALKPEWVCTQPTVLLIACMYEKNPLEVAMKVVNLRKKWRQK